MVQVGVRDGAALVEASSALELLACVSKWELEKLDAPKMEAANHDEAEERQGWHSQLPAQEMSGR